MENNESKIHINPENRMSPEMLKMFSRNISNVNDAPIIGMEEGVTMPLFMSITNMEFFNRKMNLLVAITYVFKDQTMSYKGRLRFEDTGNKTIFQDKESSTPYSESNLAAMKDKIRELVSGMEAEPDNGGCGFKIVDGPHELEFNVSDTMDDVLKKVNDSNLFNIGTIKKDKQKNETK